MKLPPIIHLFEVTADLISGLRGRRRTYHTILKLADHAFFKMRLLRPELDLSKVSCHVTSNVTCRNNKVQMIRP
jgi:hypothetical protein